MDQLVVFENRVIIFSDKDCKFPDSGNPSVDWARWYRNAVAGSVRQLEGAERWIKEHPTRIFSDQACTISFPIPIPGTSKMIFHRIIVAHGAGERCAKHFGGSGSLMIDIPGDMNNGEYGLSDSTEPFVIGRLGSDGRLIHVFDDMTADLILSKLDTISDFVAYLDKKEALLESGIGILATGEEEMLANYLLDMNDSGEHDFSFDRNQDVIYFAEGTWEEFRKSAVLKMQSKADQVSYQWDRLIEVMSSDIRYGKLRNPHPEAPVMGERILRLMASESRFHRRMLARLMSEAFMETPPKADRYARIVDAKKWGDPYYVFMTLKKPHSLDIDSYRNLRIEMLEMYCAALIHKYPPAQRAIGIATELGGNASHSFDFLYYDREMYFEDDIHEVECMSESMKLLVNLRKNQVTDFEYPGTSIGPTLIPLMKGRSRNAQCPCGSGKKFKHCCGSRQANSLLRIRTRSRRKQIESAGGHSPWETIDLDD